MSGREFRAYAGEDYGFAVRLVIVDATDEEKLVARLKDGRVSEWVPVEEGVMAEPTLLLDDEIARALLAALADHYHHGEDSRALRLDYAMICRRLDRLTEDVAAILDAAQ
jgi:hypothetical protein